MNDLAGKDLSGQDLRNVDFTGFSLFQTDLRGAKLYGAKISLTCATFDGVLLDDDQMAMLLLMISQAQTSTTSWRAGLRMLVEERIGAETLRTLDRYLGLA